MSYHTYFMYSQGLSSDIVMPPGEFQRIKDHIREVEQRSGYFPEKYMDNPAHWNKRQAMPLSDEDFCQLVMDHNRWVRTLYADMGKWSTSPPDPGEVVTPDQFQEVWHGLEMLFVPAGRWSANYYQAEMETAYEVMRGRSVNGVLFDADALTAQQAAAVIALFEEALGLHDLRLDVCLGEDHLTPGDDYHWCQQHGAIADDDYELHADQCRHFRLAHGLDDEGGEPEEVDHG